MLSFREIEIGDKELVNSFVKKKNYFLCGYSFTDMFIWRMKYGTKIAAQDGFLFIKTEDKDGKEYFCAPLGDGDYACAMGLLKEYADDRGQKLRLVTVPPEKKELIEKVMPDFFGFVPDRDSADYVYLAEKLMYLKGKKLHGKRNHINKFMQTHGNWSYEVLDECNTKEFFAYHLDWCKGTGGEFLDETCALSAALKNREALGITGGILRLDGRIIAVTLGSESFDDTFTVHIEKADPEIQGAYQMINQQFALHNFEKYTYIDREEDLGIAGLRKAKLSYYPEFIAENYYAEAKQ